MPGIPDQTADYKCDPGFYPVQLGKHKASPAKLFTKSCNYSGQDIKDCQSPDKIQYQHYLRSKSSFLTQLEAYINRQHLSHLFSPQWKRLGLESLCLADMEVSFQSGLIVSNDTIKGTKKFAGRVSEWQNFYKISLTITIHFISTLL